ncbi:MAG: serine--tRNA ligase, partial [Desulfobacteraceae bacterium]
MNAMLDLKFIRNNLEAVKQMLKNRGNPLDLTVFETIDQKRRDILPELENLRSKRNKVGEEIAQLKKKGQDAALLIAEMKQVADTIKIKEIELAGIDDQLKPLLMDIPNMPHSSVPIGIDSSQNPIVRTWGRVAKFDFEPRNHWDIGENLKILDFACAGKISGARFTLYRGLGARL